MGAQLPAPGYPEFHVIHCGDKKIFLTLLYGMFFSAEIGLYKKVHCGKNKHGSEKRFSDMKSTGYLQQDQVVLKGL